MIPVCDYTSCFTHHIAIFGMFGFWKPQKKMKFEIMYNFYKYVMLVIWIVFIVSEIIYMVINRTNIDEFTATLFLAILLTLILIKMLVLYQNMDSIQSMIADLNRPLFQVKNMKQYHIAEAALKLASNYFYLCLFFGSSTDVFWCLAPFLGKNRTTFEKGWYPFDWHVSPNYEFLYVYQAFVCIMNTLLCLNQDAFYATLTTQISLQCELLCDTLHNLDSYQDKDGLLFEVGMKDKIAMKRNKEKFSTQMTRNIKICITHHRQILK